MQNTVMTTPKVTPLREFLSFALIILIALIIRTLCMELFFVPTASMKATILENDYIFSTKYSYGYSRYSLPFSPNIFSGRIMATLPQRGDIIIFRPPNNMSLRYIKRLIGLPGDKIQLINDVIYINDQPIKRVEAGFYENEAGKIYKKFKETLPNGVSYFSYKLQQRSDLQVDRYSTTNIFYIPEGKYFFLGDNRDESNDSRIDLGYVPFENFIAKARFIIFSTKETIWNSDVALIDQIFLFETWARVGTWITSIRFNRLFLPLYVDEVQSNQTK